MTGRAEVFGTAAATYDRVRPAPSREAVAWLLPPAARTAVDLGAGTGLVSRALAPLVPDVVAVEPDARMRAVLGDAPGIRVLDGTAEAIPLRDGCADVVTASSAWHWFDPQRAVPEIARVLRPGGVLALMWSYADTDVAWVAEVRTVGRSAEDGSARLRRSRFDVELPTGSPFTPGLRRDFDRTAPMTREDIATMIGTYSGVLTRSDEERAAIHARARRVLDERPELAGVGPDEPVDVPLRTTVWCAVRAG